MSHDRQIAAQDPDGGWSIEPFYFPPGVDPRGAYDQLAGEYANDNMAYVVGTEDLDETAFTNDPRQATLVLSGDTSYVIRGPLKDLYALADGILDALPKRYVKPTNMEDTLAFLDDDEEGPQ